MEAIGAIASIAQVAQLGTQLSLTLYNVAQTIGSANKDVQSIAKDISLFSAVLKDLGRAFERGKSTQLYRADAYDTSLLIVKECKAVFSEIEGVLTKSSKDASAVDKGFSLDRAGKVMWLFRKSRVQLLRSNLESLKSTILVELAVLNYAEKVSSPAVQDRGNVDDLLALKSLVLANEAATQEFRDLVSSTKDRLGSAPSTFGPMATYGVGNLLQGPLLLNGHGGSALLPQATTDHLQSFAMQSDAQKPLPGLPVPDPPHGMGPTVTSIAAPTSPKSARYAKLWGMPDRLEHALRKVELAKWEQERLEENLLADENGRMEDQAQATTIFLQRLQNSLLKFGLSQTMVRNVISLFREQDPPLGTRTAANQQMTSTFDLQTVLGQLGISWSASKDGIDTLRVKRWMPDLLEDVLWEQTRRSLGGPPDADTLSIHGSGKGPYVDETIVSQSQSSNLTPERRVCSFAPTDTIRPDSFDVAMPLASRSQHSGTFTAPLKRREKQCQRVAYSFTSGNNVSSNWTSAREERTDAADTISQNEKVQQWLDQEEVEEPTRKLKRSRSSSPLSSEPAPTLHAVKPVQANYPSSAAPARLGSSGASARFLSSGASAKLLALERVFTEGSDRNPTAVPIPELDPTQLFAFPTPNRAGDSPPKRFKNAGGGAEGQQTADPSTRMNIDSPQDEKPPAEPDSHRPDDHVRFQANPPPVLQQNSSSSATINALRDRQQARLSASNHGIPSVPPTSSLASAAFLQAAGDLESASRCASRGSNSDDDVESRDAGGARARQEYFRRETDGTSKVVRHLLGLWTFLDVSTALDG